MLKPNALTLGHLKRGASSGVSRLLLYLEPEGTKSRHNSRVCSDLELNKRRSRRFRVDGNSDQGLSTRKKSTRFWAEALAAPPGTRAADGPRRRDSRSLQASPTLQDVGRAHVDLGDHHKDRHIERQCQAQMLLGHPHDASIAAHLPEHRKSGQGEGHRGCCRVGHRGSKAAGARESSHLGGFSQNRTRGAEVFGWKANSCRWKLGEAQMALTPDLTRSAIQIRGDLQTITKTNPDSLGKQRSRAIKATFRFTSLASSFLIYNVERYYHPR